MMPLAMCTRDLASHDWIWRLAEDLDVTVHRSECY